MKQVKLGNQPSTLPSKNALLDFELESGQFARVTVEVLPSAADRVLLRLQAFQVDAEGNFVAYTTGAPSRTSGITRAISTRGLNDTWTLKPGWIRVHVPDGGPVVPPHGAIDVATKPVGEPADPLVWVYVDNKTYYRWDQGEVVRLAGFEARKLQQLIAVSGTALDISE